MRRKRRDYVPGSRGSSDPETLALIAEIERKCDESTKLLQTLNEQIEQGNPFAENYKNNYIDALAAELAELQKENQKKRKENKRE